MIVRDIYRSDILELAKLLRRFDESAYRLELNGEDVSRSSWDVKGFDGFEIWKASSRSTLHVKVLQGDDGPISSPAAQPGAARSRRPIESQLFVKFEGRSLSLWVVYLHDTVSVLFERVFEKLNYSPSPSKIFYLKIGLKSWKQMGGKSWKQEDAESTTTTLKEACCHHDCKELTIPAYEVEVELIPLSIAYLENCLEVHVNLSYTSLVGLAALVEERLKISVVHFSLGSDNFYPTGIRRHEPLKALGIAADSKLIVNCLSVEANYAARAEAAGQQYSEVVHGPLLAPAAAAKDGELPGLDDAAAAKEEEQYSEVVHGPLQMSWTADKMSWTAEASHEKNADAAAAAAAAASDAAATASTPATSVSLIPLWGPEKYGVWQGRVVDGVAELRAYLLANWSPSGCKLPMHGCSPIYCYADYDQTAALYDRDLQMQNTLRWSHSVTRQDHLRRYLPGYQQIEQAVMRLLLAVFPRWLVLGLGLHNGHMLRQFFAADGGSGFSGHIDEADGASKTLLYLSVIVKLTADPVGAHGTWMQVDGYPPVRYGSVDGAVVIFLSRSKHSSLRTPHNMGKVLKLALFYKFTDPQLIAQYQEVAPPALARGTPLEFSILPSQVPKDPHTPYNLIPSHLTCFVLTSSHLVPSHLIPSHLAPAGCACVGWLQKPHGIGCKSHATCNGNDGGLQTSLLSLRGCAESSICSRHGRDGCRTASGVPQN
jgi:hypothetical protein